MVCHNPLIFQVPDGRTRCRPVFIPCETFCKGFKVRYKPPAVLPSLAATEEINYSKVAIK
jgi:hypothetical protein